MEPDNPLLDDFVFGLTGKHRPRVCFLATASGDAMEYIERFHQNMSSSLCRATHLSLFVRDKTDLRRHLLRQDVIYVGGGNTANLLAVWRAHGVDDVLRAAWRKGIVLTGISAGANCWFEAACTDSFGPLAALQDGLELLSGAVCPHYDGERHRRPAFRQFVASGQLPDGLALDDGVAAHFVGRRLVETVSSRLKAKAYRVFRRGNRAVEQPLATRFLGVASRQPVR